MDGKMSPTKRKLRFVPYSVQIRDFRKFAKEHLGELPKDTDNSYVLHHMTLDEMQEIFDAGWSASEVRQRDGGAKCGE